MAKFNLKKLNIKGLFVEHGEKLGFGLSVLIVLAVLGAATSWGRYEKLPKEIEIAANNAETTIKAQGWPQDLRANFGLKDYGEKTRELRGPLSITNYEYSTPLWHPLYRKQELAKEPDLYAVLDLQADAGTFIFAVAPKVEATDPMLATTGAPGTTPAAATAIDNEFGPVRGAAPPGSPMGPGGVGLNDGGANPYVVPGVQPPNIQGANAMDGMTMFMNGMSGGVGEYGATLAPGVTGRGERFIAVRGVWPLKQQLDKIQRALNLQSLNDARAVLDITDFKLERQTAIAGSDPWAGPWEVVDIQRAVEALNESADYDIDMVDPRLTHHRITQPLLKRLLGRWADLATHPQIKNFQLTGPELEKELRLQERLKEEYDRLQKNQPAPRKNGGFGGTQVNFRGMAETMYSNPEMQTDFQNSMNRWMTTDPNAGQMMRGTSMPDLKSRLTAVERLLLFRYYDLDVRPGYAYRYRVKLEIYNPNYQKPPEQIVDKSVAEGEYRETPWSTPSNVAVVPESTNFFLKDVERDPLHESVRSASKTLASLMFYQWDPSVGTTIADTVRITSIGQFLGEKRKSLKLDVAVPSFKDEEVVFHADDVFLDGLTDVKLPMEDHKDLRLAADRRGKIGLVAEALLLGPAGELKALTPNEDPEHEAYLRNRLDRERAQFRNIENQEPQPANPLDGGVYPGVMMDGGAMDPTMMGMQKGKKSRSKKNPLRPDMGAHMGP